MGPDIRDTVDSNRHIVGMRECAAVLMDAASQRPGRRPEGRTPNPARLPLPWGREAGAMVLLCGEAAAALAERRVSGQSSGPGDLSLPWGCWAPGHQGPSCCYQRLTWLRLSTCSLPGELGPAASASVGHMAAGAQRPVGFPRGHRLSPHGSRPAAPGTPQPRPLARRPAVSRGSPELRLSSRWCWGGGKGFNFWAFQCCPLRLAGNGPQKCRCQPSEPVSATLFGKRVSEEVSKVR